MLVRTASVFEHESIRVGDALRASDQRPLRFDGRQFEALARFADAHRERHFKVGHSRICFQQHVGYVQVGDLGFEVLPKADRLDAPHAGRWRSALLEMLRVANGVEFLAPCAASQGTAPRSALELIAGAFLTEVEQLCRQGLAKAYCTRDENGGVLRGRLLVTENARANAARADRFFVQFASYERDIPINRILREAVAVLTGLPLSARQHGRALAAVLAFGELTPIRPSAAFFEQVVLGRSTERYRHALALARLLLEHRGPNLRAGPAPVFALLFDMNVLWERYVAALFRRALAAPWRLSTQECVPFWQADDKRTKKVRPDLVVRRDGVVVLVGDTKWKCYAGGSPADDDLKQMFVYNELLRCPQSLLIYPASAQRAPAVVGRYAGARPHVCRTMSLGLFKEGAMRTASLVDELRVGLGEIDPRGRAGAVLEPSTSS